MAHADQVVAFGPGRANLIGEHTDYNDGLSLPFAIDAGVTVRAVARDDRWLVARAAGRGEEERFDLDAPIRSPDEPGGSARTEDWRDFVRGTVAELRAAGLPPPAAELTIAADLPTGGGLSSSAAFEAALCLALLGLGGGEREQLDRVELARLCARVESRWVGARTGLLDQLASLLGRAGHALRIDFRTLAVRPVPLRLDGWRLVAVDSGERRALAASGYNERRAECDRARELLGLASLRDALPERLGELPAPLDRRVRHAIEENARVDATVAALEAGDLTAVGRLLDASHASLRDLYDASTPAVERTVARLRDAGAAGARMMGGGFGGHAIALLAPGVEPPSTALALTPSAGARLVR